MLFCRFMDEENDVVRWGMIEGGQVLALEGAPFERIKPSGGAYNLEQVRLLAPCQPSKVVCVGLNYADHAKELNLTVPDEPIIFIKPASTVIGPGDPIIYPAQSTQVDYEAELGVVIGKLTRKISPAEAREKIFGYTCGNDVTARDLQRKDGQWTRAKSFDTFCPLGPWIKDDFKPKAAEIKLSVNQILKQDSNTRQMLFSVDYLVSFISQVMTLLPGDVVLTGTPFGVGPVKPGDTIEVEIQGLGRLTNRVKSEGF